MACKTTYVLQKDANKNILGDLSHEDYTAMMLSHTKETLMREYRFRHYMETILPIMKICLSYIKLEYYKILYFQKVKK